MLQATYAKFIIKHKYVNRLILKELPFYQTTNLFNLIKLPQNNLNIFTYLNIFSMSLVSVCLVTFVHYDFATRTHWRVNKIEFQIMIKFVCEQPIGHRCWGLSGNIRISEIKILRLDLRFIV